MNNSDTPQNTINTLNTNITDICTSLEKIHGVEHTNLTMLFFCLQQNISELENICCEFIPKENQSHDVAHILCSSSMSALMNLCNAIVAKIPEHKTLAKDTETLIKRAYDDFHSKR